MKLKDVVSAVVVLIFIGIAVYIVLGWIKERNALGTETMKLTEFYEVDDDKMMVFENGRDKEKYYPYLEGHLYLPLDYVSGKNDRFYWDAGLDKLIYTTGDSIQIIEPEKKSYISENGFIEEGEETDGIEVPTDYVILTEIDEDRYIAYDYVKEALNITVDMYLSPNRVVIRSKWSDYLYATVSKDTQLRAEGNIKGAVLRELPAGTKLELTDSNGSNRNGFLLALTEDGVLAYVDEKYLGESFVETAKSNYKEPAYPHKTVDGKVNLVWNVVVARDKNNDIQKLMKSTKGINVLSPTWFNLKDEEGGIDDRASADYIKYAHDNGIMVWALFSNFHPGTNELKINEANVLSDRKKRAILIKKLMDAADKYGFDGINVDFENIAKATGPHYVQFLRELSVACRYKDLYLSVDNFVPFDFNAYYDLNEQSCFADYIVIMAYDEHYVGSEAGSVASLTYVNTAITNTLKKVDASQVVMGMPFYTRIWRVVQLTDGNHKTYSDTATMAEAAKFIKDHNLTGHWYEDEGQYFYTSDEGNTTYKLWNEDLDSIRVKLEKIRDAGIAGTAGWRLGQEDSGVWPLIQEYIK